MNTENSQSDKHHAREVEFFVVNNSADVHYEQSKGTVNTGTLIDLNSTGMGMLTHIQLQPGDMVRLNHGGTSALGVVMWSIESSNKFRVQMRFVS